MGYFGRSLYHSAQKRDGSMNSTSKEKGTDGKNNNTSEYNHQYYMKNKEKWGVKYDEYKDDDKDFDDDNYSEKNRLGDTDFYGLQKPDGSWVILEEDMKFTIPKGMSREEIISRLEAFDKEVERRRENGEHYTNNDWVNGAKQALSGGKSDEQEFDVDAAARDVIRGKYKNGAERKAALGDDYEIVQKRVNELMKKEKNKSVKHSYEEYDDNYLEHHGILGQRWGIRRFQNKDGTLTPAGRKHQADEGYDRESRSKSGGFDKKKFAKGAAVAAGVAVGVALIANPTTRATLAKYGSTAIKGLGKGAGTLAAKTVNGGKAIAKKTGERLDKVADAMVDAALLSAGGVAIDRVSKELDPGENATESQKDRAKILTDTVTAGIKTATGASNGSNNSNSGNKGGNVGKEITDLVGSPTNKPVDTNSDAYINLFKGVDKETSSNLKQMRKKGFDIDQLQKYKDSMGHAEFEDWLTQYAGVEIGW